MGHIFISYSHKDKDYVHKLQKALQNEGFEVWIDDRIDYGDEWPMVIQERLDECQAFILLASENSYKSRWVQKEVARAQRINKAVFPLLLSGHPWLSIESTQYVDVRDKSLPPERFYSRLASVATRVKSDSELPATTQIGIKAYNPEKRINRDKVRNQKTKVTLIWVGIALGVLAIIVAALVGAGRYFGFINTKDPYTGTSTFISRLRTATDEEGRYSVSTFAKDQTVYLVFDVNSRSSTTYESKWYYKLNFFGNDVNILTAKLNYPATPSDRAIYFRLNNPGATGQYRVDIYRDQLLIGTAYFSIK